jgi:Tfp pilus assembly protein PilF
VALLRQGEAAEARTYLLRASRQPGSALAGKAQYHLGMAQWRSGQLPQAQATLRAVAEDAQNPYRADAQTVLHDNVLTTNE